MINTTKTTRYTATLPVEYIDELKALARSRQVPSVSFAIRQAIDDYLTQLRKERYAVLMEEAAKDTAFIKRTMDCDAAFEYADGEVFGEW